MSSCTPGMSITCACVDGRTGAQVCQPDGTFGGCACLAGPDGGRDAADATETRPDSMSDAGELDAAVDAAVPDDADAQPVDALDVIDATDAAPDVADESRRCARNADCTSLEYCESATGRCVASPQRCGLAEPCPAGYFCGTRRVCVASCGGTDCAALGAELVCDDSENTCEPPVCSAADPCPSGALCIGGSCRLSSEVCTFNYQCRAGEACVDGRCVVAGCTAGAPDGGTGGCPAEQVCTDGYCAYPTGAGCTCPAGQVCANGSCLVPCDADSQCGSGRFCDHGACRVDDRRAPPFCPTNACASGGVCIDGACRMSCASDPTDNYCMRVDLTFTRCDTSTTDAMGNPAPICRYENEVTQQCSAATNQMCPAGQRCIDGRCR